MYFQVYLSLLKLAIVLVPVFNCPSKLAYKNTRNAYNHHKLIRASQQQEIEPLLFPHKHFKPAFTAIHLMWDPLINPDTIPYYWASELL